MTEQSSWINITSHPDIFGEATSFRLNLGSYGADLLVGKWDPFDTERVDMIWLGVRRRLTTTTLDEAKREALTIVAKELVTMSAAAAALLARTSEGT